MKKLYIQPEFDLLKLSSSEDILENSLEEKAYADQIFNNGEGGTSIDSVDQDYDDEPGNVDEWA